MRRWLLAPFLVIGILVLSGCSSYVDSDQTSIVPAAEVRLAPDHPVGQTFVARHGGLDGIDVWLRALPGSQGQLQLHVRESADSRQDLTVSTLPVAAAAATDIQHFAFPPLADSNNRYLYAVIELEGQGEVRVSAAPGTAYRDGSLYRDHTPVADGQLAFRLAYDRGLMLLDLARFTLSSIGLVVIALLVFVVPGWAIVAWSARGGLVSWGEVLGLAAGVGVGLPALIILWTSVVGLHLGALNIWLPVAIGVLFLAWRYRATRWAHIRLELRRWACSDALWPDLALIVILALLFFMRLVAIRTLDAPSWGDSVQHAVIGQLFVDHGGMFSSWEPYAPYRTLSVHYGFSAIVAWLVWATGLTSVQATLVAGQLVNVLSVLCLYPVATRLAKGKRWAGVTAVLGAGLLSTMPASYLNWGRYAQLAALAVLPVALWYLIDAWESERPKWPAMVMAGLAVAGMTLNNFRLPYMYAVFVAAWILSDAISRGRRLPQTALRLLRLIPVGVVALLAMLPYVKRVASGNLPNRLDLGLDPGALLQHVLANYQVWRDWTTYVPVLLAIPAVIAILLSLWRRHWIAASIGLWALGMAALPAGQLIHLPGAYVVDSFAVLITLYIPVGILIGWLFGEFIAWLQRGGKQLTPVAVCVALVVLGGWGGFRQLDILKPQFILVNRPDVRAMDWIRRTTGGDARFLVEGFTIWGGTSAVGSDAGWWIPLLGARANTMPPQYALVDEAPEKQGYSQSVVDLVAHLETASSFSSETVRMLCDQHVTHVYLGQSQGSVGAGVKALYKPVTLMSSPAFNLVYRQDRVYIFALDSAACR